MSNKVCFETERPKEAAMGQAAAAGVANCAEKEELDSHTRTDYNSEEERGDRDRNGGSHK